MGNNEHAAKQWPAIEYETLPWERDPDELAMVPKSRRRKIGPTYQAAIPLDIASRHIALPSHLASRMSEVLVALARFDAKQGARGYDLPALLLRSESSASSQIENLTSSARNVALAELSPSAPGNAKLIAGNVAAMRKALSLPGELTVEGILAIHRALMNRNDTSFGGSLRHEQVWVGGTAYSPHGAIYVPPHPSRVATCLNDLMAFARRGDLDPVVKAAILHAQLETIHPFIDGNGRTGRTLLHKVLRDEGVLLHTTLPVSAGLLHNTDAYMKSLVLFQKGDPIAVVEQLADALEMAVLIGNLAANELDAILEEWQASMTERAGSSIHRLPNILIEQPVIDAAYLASKLEISLRATTSLINRACEYGILRPLGNKRRGEFYQSDEIIDVLEEISASSSKKATPSPLSSSLQTHSRWLSS